MPKRFVSLRQHLLRSLLAVLLPLSMILLVVSLFAGRIAAEYLASSLTREAIEQTEAELRLFFGPVVGMLSATRVWTHSGLITTDSVEEMRRLGQGLLLQESQVTSFLVADERGQEIMLLKQGQHWRARQTKADAWGDETRWLEWEGDADAPVRAYRQALDYDPRDRPWYRNAIGSAPGDGAETAVHWSGPYILFTSQEPGISASTALTAPNGLLTVVALDLRLGDIARFTRALGLSERGGVLVRDRDGRLLGLPGDPYFDAVARQRQALMHSPEQLAWAPAVAAASSLGNQPWGDLRPVRFQSDGESWWAARKAFVLGPEARLWIDFLVPESELLGGLRYLPWLVAVVLLLTLALGVWRTMSVTRRFSAPIEQLVRNSDRLRVGDFAQPTPVASPIKEVQRLARAQVRMRDGLLSLMKFERDLRLARQIQRDTLPRTLPLLRNFDLDAWTEPAEETGGDTFDVVACAPRRDGSEAPEAGLAEEPMERAVVFVADATGHGVGPALTAAAVRAMLRMAMRAGQELNAIARHINDQLYEDLGQGRFVTAWLAEVDCDGCRIRGLSAGQGPILRYRRQQALVQALAADGPPMGILPGAAPEVGAWMPMEPGDMIAVISDGIFEATDPAGEQFGIERVADILQACCDLSAASIRAALVERLGAFTQGRSADDDRTIVIIKRTGVRPT